MPREYEKPCIASIENMSSFLQNKQLIEMTEQKESFEVVLQDSEEE